MLRNFRSFLSGNERSRFAAAGSCAHSGAACPAALAMRMNDKPPFACITSPRVLGGPWSCVPFARKERQIRAPGHASSRWNHQTRQHTECPAVAKIHGSAQGTMIRFERCISTQARGPSTRGCLGVWSRGGIVSPLPDSSYEHSD